MDAWREKKCTFSIQGVRVSLVGRVWAPALALLSACVYITPKQEAERWDLDGDGVPRPLDCDDDDPSAQTASVWYLDADGDGVGASEQRIEHCEPPAGYVAADGDCDDTDASVHPGAPELCDGLDNDCDGALDEDLVDQTWYADGDGDGYGDPEGAVSACGPQDGLVAEAGDCDDAAPDIHPGALEICNDRDDDCDGAVDADDPSVTGAAWHVDADGDGYGASAGAIISCEPVPGRVDDGTDCDDDNDRVHPGALELCDGYLDDDCDGAIDEDDAADAGTWYVDGDGDGFGGPATAVTSCARPDGTVGNALDCDDADPLVHPLADEICDAGIDNDCDTLIDDDDPTLTDPPLWFDDADGDGFGAPGPGAASCAPPLDAADNALDCDDSDPAVNPGAAEVCNALDDDCDGQIDDEDAGVDLSTAPSWHADADGDGAGNPDVVLATTCARPEGGVDDATDCDDADPLARPGHPELCDGVDNDCNTLIDDGSAPVDWYPDADGDRFGADQPAISSCERQAGRALQPGDCDDADPDIHPGALEICNALDDDCDLLVDTDDPDVATTPWFADVDGDGHGDPNARVDACEQPQDHVATSDDCDDTNASISPSAWELCNGLDDDCDLLVDDADPDRIAPIAWYGDTDGDGFGDTADRALACEPPPGYLPAGGDCDDANPDVNPDAVEICDDIDNDCDLLVDDADPDRDPSTGTRFFLDVDGDGYGDQPTAPACTIPPSPRRSAATATTSIRRCTRARPSCATASTTTATISSTTAARPPGTPTRTATDTATPP